MVKVRDRLDEMAEQERLRLRVSLRHLPSVAKTGVRRAVRHHPVAIGIGAAAIAAGVVTLVTVATRKRKQEAPLRYVEVSKKRAGASSKTASRLTKLALKIVPALLLGGSRQDAKFGPLEHVARQRRSPWSSSKNGNGAGHAYGSSPKTDPDVSSRPRPERHSPAHTGASGGFVDGASTRSPFTAHGPSAGGSSSVSHASMHGVATDADPSGPAPHARPTNARQGDLPPTVS
jgi:hypothetical protein